VDAGAQKDDAPAETGAGAQNNDVSAETGAGRETVILLFETTHHAMEAEAAIIDGGFWCDVVPRPPDTMSALCGLAIEVLAGDLGEVRTALGAAGVPFEIYRPEVEAF